MKDVLHKTKEILKGRGKTIIMQEHKEDKQCVSDVRKTFIYLAAEADIQGESSIPQVHVQKFFDSVTQDENFSFRVKGFFYVHRNRRLMKVDYSHTLKIRLHWKDQVSSPKKSVTMA